MSAQDPTHQMYEGACDLLEAARAIEAGAQHGGVIEAIPATLGTIEEALQVLGAGCHRLAADATREPVLVSESEAQLLATLHEVGSSIAHASSSCRAGREAAAPLIARKVAGVRPGVPAGV